MVIPGVGPERLLFHKPDICNRLSTVTPSNVRYLAAGSPVDRAVQSLLRWLDQSLPKVRDSSAVSAWIPSKFLP